MDSPHHADSYEIFHDVLARVILDYVKVQDAERAKERVRRQYFISAGLAAGLVLALLLSGFAWWQWGEAKRATEHAKRSEAEAKKQAQLAQTAEEKCGSRPGSPNLRKRGGSRPGSPKSRPGSPKPRKKRRGSRPESPNVRKPRRKEKTRIAQTAEE